MTPEQITSLKEAYEASTKKHYIAINCLPEKESDYVCMAANLMPKLLKHIERLEATHETAVQYIDEATDHYTYGQREDIFEELDKILKGE